MAISSVINANRINYNLKYGARIDKRRKRAHDGRKEVMWLAPEVMWPVHFRLRSKHVGRYNHVLRESFNWFWTEMKTLIALIGLIALFLSQTSYKSSVEWKRESELYVNDIDVTCSQKYKIKIWNN